MPAAALAFALAAPARAIDPVATPAVPIDGHTVGIGRLAPAVAGDDLAGKPWSLDQAARAPGAKALVIALTSATCPVSSKLAPTLGAIEKDYLARGVRFVYLSAFEADTNDQLAAMAKAAGMTAPLLTDRDHAAARALGARTSAEVFVLDPARTIIYRGAIDDQYAVGAAKAAPTRTFLRDAIDAALAGRRPAVQATTAPGCVLDSGAAGGTPGSSAAVTYHNRVSRIIADNCLECHRAGGIGPFPLETFDDVRSHAAMMARMVDHDRMPPWFAAPPAPGEPSPWANDARLSPQDKADLLAWLRGDRPAGDPADAPAKPVFVDGWRIGTPDAVLQLPRAIEVKATGTMPYQHVKVETDWPEDRWIQAVEIVPSSRQVVHHVLVFVLPRAEGRQRLAEAIDETRGFFAAYVPGNGAVTYPAGFAKLLPAGSTLLFQIHYTPAGTATTDQMKLGLVFAPSPPKHQVRTIGIANRRISIPPNAPDHAETAALRVPATAEILSFVPHMHVRGKAFRYELLAPGAEPRVLLDVPQYDFNWQLRYSLREPIAAPAGSTIRVTARYDNSEANAANPDPSARVRWGQQTTDEMMLGYIEYFLPGEDAGASKPADTDRATRLKRALERLKKPQ